MGPDLEINSILFYSMITQEICHIRTVISTHKHLGKCIYLLFVWLAVIGFRQNYFYRLHNFGDFGTIMAFFHYIINQKRNNFIKHCPPPPPVPTQKPLISEMCIYIKSYLCKWVLVHRGGGGGGGGETMFHRQHITGVPACKQHTKYVITNG